MITWLIWTIWTRCPLSPKKDDKLNLSLSLGLALLTLSWDKNCDSHSLMNGYPSFYPRIALVAQAQVTLGVRASACMVLTPKPGYYGWPKWTKSAKGSTYEKFHVRKHTRIKSFVYKTIRVSKVSCLK